MVNPKDLMQKASKREGTSPAETRPSYKKKSQTTKAEPVKVVEEKQEQVIAEQEVAAATPTPVVNEGLPQKLAAIKRPDAKLDDYGIAPVRSNFELYNKEVYKFMTSFSRDNQFSGGGAITKSQLVEVILDVVVYDLDIEAVGFKNPNELRNYLVETMKNYK